MKIMKKCLLILLVGIVSLSSCNDDEKNARFEPFDELSAQFYMQENYTEWYKVMEATGLAPSFNLGSTPLTCFVVNNEALLAYVQGRGYNSVESWVAAEKEFATRFIRYHTVLGKEYELSAFRNGKLRDSTASGDFLVCSFSETGGIYINHVGKIVRWDDKVVNGIVHELSEAIDPVTETLYDYVKNSDRYSLFAAAIDATATAEAFRTMLIEQIELRSRRTLMVTSDATYRANGISSLADLQERISPGRNDYTDPGNPLNLYVLYHLMEGDFSTAEYSRFFEWQDKFINKTVGYTLPTLATNQLVLIQQKGMDFLFNSDRRLVEGYSNIQLRNGFAHEIDGVLEIVEYENILTTVEPTESINFTKFAEYRNAAIYRYKQFMEVEEFAPALSWTTTPADKANCVAYFCHSTGNYNHSSFMLHGDCLFTDLGAVGQVTIITRPIPKGTYQIQLIGRTIKQVGGIFQPYLDGVKIGGRFSLYDPEWDRDNTFTVSSSHTFEETSSHTFTLKATKAGQMHWDSIIFTPVN